ncbi:Ig-like domain-containing protein [Candidatus Palauibacter sp.]|uniref:Ig-like domain-containing protein n=1 Tax=Candidatus Palauibacter sp. TaxID=3101350 RepID=UPI003B517884
MRRLLCGALLVSLGAWWVACSDARTGPPPPAPPPLEPNHPPTAVGAIPGQSAMVGDTVALTVASYFADPDGDRLAYDARSSDPEVATVSTAGDTVTVVALRRGAETITVTASDPDGLEASQTFDVTVLNSGPAAAGRIPDLELPLGEEATVEVSPYFTDPDGDSLTYRAESSDPALAAAASAGSELTIRALARGAATIAVTAADPDGLEAALDFEVTVPNSGPAAGGSPADLELRRGGEATVELSSHFTDPDGDVLTYRAESSDPAVAAAAAAGSELTIRALARGSATITVTAADPDGLEAALDFEVTVPNSGPAAGGSPADLELRRGGEATVELSSHFTDPDGDMLTYRAESSDPAVAAAAAAGSELTIRALARGAATVTVTAADPDGLEAALAFEVTVPNSGPVAGGSLADLELRRGDAATVELSSYFTDPDGDVLTYRAESSDPAVAAAAAAGSELTIRALATSR